MNRKPSPQRIPVAWVCLILGNILIASPALIIGLGLAPWWAAAPLLLVTALLAVVCLVKDEIVMGATLLLAVFLVSPANGYFSWGIAAERLKESPEFRQEQGTAIAEELTRLVSQIRLAGGSVGPGPDYTVNTASSSTAIMCCRLGYTPSGSYIILKFDHDALLDPDDYEVSPDGIFRYIGS